VKKLCHRFFQVYRVIIRQDESEKSPKKLLLLFSGVVIIYSAVYENMVTSDLTIKPPEDIAQGFEYFVENGYQIGVNQEISEKKILKYINSTGLTDKLKGKKRTKYLHTPSTEDNLGLMERVDYRWNSDFFENPKIAIEVALPLELFNSEITNKWTARTKVSKSTDPQKTQKIPRFAKEPLLSIPQFLSIASIYKEDIVRYAQNLIEAGLENMWKRITKEEVIKQVNLKEEKYISTVPHKSLIYFDMYKRLYNNVSSVDAETTENVFLGLESLVIVFYLVGSLWACSFSAFALEKLVQIVWMRMNSNNNTNEYKYPSAHDENNEDDVGLQSVVELKSD